MKSTNIKKVISLVAAMLLVALLCVTLTACLKINMSKNNIIDRLKEEGASIDYLRTTPMTANSTGLRLGDIVFATMQVKDDDGNDIDECVYVIFCLNDDTSKEVEKLCKSYIEDNKEIEDGEYAYSDWNYYRYDRIVMCGHYKVLRVARTY